MKTCHDVRWLAAPHIVGMPGTQTTKTKPRLSFKTACARQSVEVTPVASDGEALRGGNPCTIFDVLLIERHDRKIHLCP